MIIDSQVHVYEANTPQRPWHSVPNWADHATGDEMVVAMDKVGVDGAIVISSFSMYRFDASYTIEVQRAHPARFAIVKPVDPDDARDGVWQHPDLLPDSADLDEPAGFIDRVIGGDTSGIDRRSPSLEKAPDDREA